MAKKKNLNGLPNNLIQQYFSTLFYFEKGYMADWIWYAANEKNKSNIEIDILKKKVTPKDLEIKQIVTYLDYLKQTIVKELKANGFPDDYIKKAKFEIYISPENKVEKIFSCVATLEDAEGKVYRSNPYAQMAYEKDFQVFKSNLAGKIIKWTTGRSN
jgi:hypothetical protein